MPVSPFSYIETIPSNWSTKKKGPCHDGSFAPKIYQVTLGWPMLVQRYQTVAPIEDPWWSWWKMESAWKDSKPEEFTIKTLTFENTALFPCQYSLSLTIARKFIDRMLKSMALEQIGSGRANSRRWSRIFFCRVRTQTLEEKLHCKERPSRRNVCCYNPSNKIVCILWRDKILKILTDHTLLGY